MTDTQCPGCGEAIAVDDSPVEHVNSDYRMHRECFEFVCQSGVTPLVDAAFHVAEREAVQLEDEGRRN
jgi:hypothetical protein